MKAVWRFGPLKPLINKIDMPTGAKALTMQNKDGDLFLWALVDPEAAPDQRSFLVIGTGAILREESDWNYVATAQVDNSGPLGTLVFHLFEDPI